MRLPLLVLLLAFQSCAGSSAPAGPAPAVDIESAADTLVATTPGAKPSPRALFGGERWGFVEASSVNGRIVVLRRFAGSEVPSFGHHGESSVATDLAMFDTVAGNERPLQDIIDIDAGRRWLLVLSDGPLLVDASTGTLTGLAADPRKDDNRCLPPRQAAFSLNGARVGWVQPGKEALRVRDLASGQEWSVPAAGRLWRGWPDDAGRGATLLELPADSQGWPQQGTSCACRWCTRFAASYGFYGWGGPTFSITHVDDAGARTLLAKPPSSDAPTHGPTERSCELEPTASDPSGVERGPWRWVCP